jgi:hypothetical protein
MMLDDQVHEVLFSDATMKLGKIHGMLLKSEDMMESKRWEATKETILSPRELTEFGKEVGMDEIHWWIFEKETDVDDLLVKTTRALESAQTLKNAASKLKQKESESYRSLLLTLKDFAEQHRAEIDALHMYVEWLMKRDVMAPCILFTYRVWGSTRRAERRLNISSKESAESEEANLKALTEIILGIRNRQDLVYNHTYHEIGFEIYESLDPEQMSDDAEIVVPKSRLIRRARYAVYDNCETYFTELRQSLRNILVDIEKFKEQRDLFQSDKFWREFIAKACHAKTTETQLWDFKETLTMWHVKHDPERRDAKVAFAEDVASFANVSGGVLIVGVNDRRQVVGVGEGRELENRLKFARDVIAQHLEYDREIVSFRQVAVPQNGQQPICLMVVISQACQAVAVTDGLGHYSYPVRRETGVSRPGMNDVPVRKLHLKNDNRDFMHQLWQFVRDN